MDPFDLTESQRIDQFLAQSPVTGEVETAHVLTAPPIAMPMHMAIDGGAYLVTAPTTGESWFLKAYAADMADQFDISRAIISSRKAGQLDIGPSVLDASEELAVVLFENLAGSRPAMVIDFDNLQVRNNALTVLGRWHGEGEAASQRTPIDLVRQWRERIEAPLTDGSMVKSPNGYATQTVWMERICDCLNSVGWDARPLHGENALTNFLIGADDRVDLVDFERSLTGDPMYDLGAVCNEYCRSENDIAQLVEIYCGAVYQRQLNRCKMYMLVDDFIWGCWGKTMHYHSPRSNQIEFYKYGENRFLRCLHHLTTWDVDACLRGI